MTIIQIAQDWAHQDPDIETKNQLQLLIDTNNTTELNKLFTGRLTFGTSGIRGKLQAGSLGMNRVVIAQTAAGLAQFLLKRQQASSNTTHILSNTLSIVIGYDGRKNSKIFALDTAEIMQGAGISAQLMADYCPTPLLSYAVRSLHATAGVMVTASHNPPCDNGYKVYLGDDDDGAQIISPDDINIAHEIQLIADTKKLNALARNSNYQMVKQEVVDGFIRETVKVKKTTDNLSTLPYVYTAMHGVGTQTLLAALQAANLPLPILVDEQCTPDANFPTVAFPNPEEAGALDLAISKAKEINAEFIVANDPDADRMAVAVADKDGNWQTLHGNDIGLYLAWYIGGQYQDSTSTGTGVMATSIVSSPLLSKIADYYGFDYQETLTGFKWIGRIPHLIYGYEESIGYLVNPQCSHDKDGISAIVAFLDFYLYLKAQGTNFAQFREDFGQQFGYAHSQQISIRVDDITQIDTVLSAVRQQPFTSIAGMIVTNYSDVLITEKNSNVLIFKLTNDKDTQSLESDYIQRVIFRPSGTEPKLKIYLDTQADSLEKSIAISQALKTELEAFLIKVL